MNTTVANQKRLTHYARRMFRKEWVLLGCGILLALLVRLFMVQFKLPLAADGVYYAILGKNLIKGNFAEGLSTYWPPFYPLLIGVSSLVFRDLEYAGLFVSVLAGSLLILPLYFLTRTYYGSRAAFISILLVAFHPELITFSISLLSESLYTLLFITGIFVGWKALTSGLGRLFFLTGGIFAGCYLTRPEAIGFMALLIGFTLAARYFNPALSRRTILRNLGALLCGFLLLAAPYLLYLRHETGRWTISEKASANQPSAREGKKWYGLRPDGQMTLADELYANARPPGLNRVAEAPSNSLVIHAPQLKPGRVKQFFRFLARIGQGLISEYRLLSQITLPLFFLLAGLGLFRKVWTPERARQEIYLMLFLLSTLVGYAATIQVTRFNVPLLPIMLCWSAKGLLELENWLVESAPKVFRKTNHKLIKHPKLLKAALLAFVLLTMWPVSIYRMKEARQSWYVQPVTAWVQEHSDATPLIMSDTPQIAFYAQAQNLYVPFEEYQTVIDYANRREVDYIIIEEEHLKKKPLLGFLLDAQNIPPELKLVYENKQHPEHRVRIFALTAHH